jgi:hypothetical protein
MNLDYVKKQRGLDFIKKGMKVQSTHSGKFGVVKGGNESGNIDVLFDGDKRPQNCHPTWKIKYFAADGSLVADFE